MVTEALANVVLVHFLVGIRIVALFLVANVFMFPVLPNIVRFWLAILMALIVVPITNVSIPMVLLGKWQVLFFVGLREFLIGAAIGFVCSLPLYAMQLSGFIDGLVMGFNMMNTFDPTTSAQVSVLAQMKYFLAIWFFFHWNGHLLMVQALVESIKLVPPGFGFGIPGQIPWTDWIQRAFEIALKISLPVIGSILLAEIGLGFVARTIPQMNVFVLGIPLKITIGFLVLLMVLPSSVDSFHGEIERAVSWALEGIHFWK